MPSSETEYLLAYKEEAEKDLALFRDLQHRLALRVADMKSRKNADLVATDLPSFSGTAAVRGSLAVSITHMEYVLEAVKTQLEASGPALKLVRNNDE